MGKFFKGARVVAVDDFEGGLKGETFIVTDPDDPDINDYHVMVKNTNNEFQRTEHRSLFVFDTDSPRFTAGDLVRAIDSDNDSGIVVGKVYTIRYGDLPSVGDYYVSVVEGDQESEFNPHRALFVLVEDE